MEHKDLDELFRDRIESDDSDLNREEQISKVEVWDQLNLPSKEKPISFPFWKIAAAVLFLLLGGSSWLVSNHLYRQEVKYIQLEQKYLDIQKTLLAAEEKSNDVESTIFEQDIAKTTTIVETKIRNKIVSISDTVWNTRLIRDTVFVEVEVKAPVQWTSLDTKLNTKIDSDSIPNKKRPSQVEFIFEKKAIKRAEQKQNIFLLDSEVAKKTNKKKRRKSIISTPNNN